MSECWKPEDYYHLETVESPDLAPDGSCSVYVRGRIDAEEKESRQHLRLLSRKEDRQLTTGKQDTAPAFSPDGRQIAFISARTEKKQIHIIPVDGGEARALETENEPLPPLLWSPGGEQIAFRARAAREDTGPRYPAEPAAVQPNDDGDETKEQSRKLEQPRVITELLYRSDSEGFTHDHRPQIFLAEVATGNVSQLSRHDPGELQSFSWHPDGKRIASAVREYDMRRTVFTTCVWELDVETGSREKLLSWDGSITQISYCPTGEHLIFAATENRDPMGTAIIHMWNLTLRGCSLPADNRRATNLTAQMNRSVMGQFCWSESDLYLPIGDQGQIRLHCLRWRDGQAIDMAEVDTPRTGVVSQLTSSNDGRVLFRAESFSESPQLFLREDAGTSQLTDVNAALLRERSMATAQPFTCRGPDGWKISGWTVEPPGQTSARRHPTVVSIHGGPTGAHLDEFSFSVQLLASNGFAVILPNPRGSITYGRRFAQGVVRDWGGGDYGDIMAAVDHAVDVGIADPQRLGVTGWSYGGYMTLWSTTQTDRFAAAVAGATIANIYSLWGTSDIAPVYNQALNAAPAFDDEEQYMGRSPIRHVRKVQTPTLILHGEADVRTPIGQSEQFFAALRRLGRESVFVRYPEQNHGLSRPQYVVDRWHRTLGWFDHHLRGV